MAYLIFTANGEEYDRRELRGPTVIGRAPDCQITIHDIILSRHHCRIEPGKGDDWIVIDLHSKNGTYLLGKKIERHTLIDGEELLIGRTRVTFKSASFVPGVKPPRPRGVPRPTDPSEALAGTVSGMVVCERGETQRVREMPFPQPRPADPSAYVREDVYGMINEIISSSWDSIMEQNAEPVRMQRVAPSPAATKVGRGDIRPKPRVSFCLQANSAPSIAQPRPAMPATVERPVTTTATPQLKRRSPRRWAVATSVLVALLLAGGVLLWMSKTTPAGAQAAPAPQPRVTPPADQAQAAAAKIAPAAVSMRRMTLPIFPIRTEGIIAAPTEATFH
jgi:hypothetical protein